MKKILIGVIGVLIQLAVSGAVYGKVLNVYSPDGTVKVSIELKDKIYYSVFTGDDILLDRCTMGMTLSDGTLGVKPVLRKVRKGTVDESRKREIPLKNETVRNHYNYLRMNMAGDYTVEFRVFDDGVDYRFITARTTTIEVVGEDFNVNFPTDYLAFFGEA